MILIDHCSVNMRLSVSQLLRTPGGWHSKAARHLEHEAGIHSASDVTVCAPTELGQGLTYGSLAAVLFIYFALLCPCCCGEDTLHMVRTTQQEVSLVLLMFEKCRNDLCEAASFED